MGQATDEKLRGIAAYFRGGEAMAETPKSQPSTLGRYMVPAGAEEKLRKMQEADHLRNLYEQQLEAARAARAQAAENAGYRLMPKPTSRVPFPDAPPSKPMDLTGYKKY